MNSFSMRELFSGVFGNFRVVTASQGKNVSIRKLNACMYEHMQV